MSSLSILETTLIDEYKRCQRALKVHRSACDEDPIRGYISVKLIHTKVQYYLQWRDGKQIKSKYIPRVQLENIQKRLEKKKIHQESIKILLRDLKQIEKAIGKQKLQQYLGIENGDE